jgi:prepilin-type N-terminal cleavage/methylation domain-containing protein
MNPTGRKNGFTLIELMITMVIIGILATFSISVFWRAKDRSLISSMESDLRTVAAKQEEYFDTHLTYAGQDELAAEFSTSPGVVLEVTYADADGWAVLATHSSLASARCGLLIGDAPVGDNPATYPGAIKCVTE